MCVCGYTDYRKLDLDCFILSQEKTAATCVINVLGRISTRRVYVKSRFFVFSFVHGYAKVIFRITNDNCVFTFVRFSTTRKKVALKVIALSLVPKKKNFAFCEKKTTIKYNCNKYFFPLSRIKIKIGLRLLRLAKQNA